MSQSFIIFHDALADNKKSVRELGDDILKKIAHELTESLHKMLVLIGQCEKVCAQKCV